jgi:hypothetical protein
MELGFGRYGTVPSMFFFLFKLKQKYNPLLLNTRCLKLTYIFSDYRYSLQIFIVMTFFYEKNN